MVEPSQSQPARSPMRLVMERFTRVRGVRTGMVLAVLFAIIAIYAPLIASETALIWRGPDGWSMPVLGDLFNRRAYPQRHDLLFNLLMFAVPVAAAAAWLLRRRVRVLALLRWAAVALVASWIACQCPIIPGEHGWQAVWTDRPVEARTIRAWTAADPERRPFAVFALVPHRYDAPYAGAILKSPGTINPVTRRRFILGTDSVGFDVLARMVFGARISLTIGIVATAITIAIGCVIGAVSGYFGGWVDLLLQRIVEIMMCFPTLILVLVVIAVLDRNIFITMAVLGFTGWAGTARLVRGEFLVQSVREYVLAAQATGLPGWRIMFRHILPNSLSPLLITATFMVAGNIFTESTLAFLGLGDPIAPSWGQMLEQGRDNIQYAWLIYIPGLAIFALLSALNILGNGLREAFDPKSTA